MIIYDSNNWVRVNLEKDFTGLGMRMCWSEACKNDGEVRIFVFDGMGGNSLRRAFYPDYKRTRKLPTDNFFENLAFFKELLANAPRTVAVAERKGFEGDDVIAELCKTFAPSTVTVLSTDKDLTAIPNAVLPMANQTFCEKRFVHLYKTLVGDPSDNLPGAKGFGKGSWEKLTTDDKLQLNKWFENGLADEMTPNINPKLWEIIRKGGDETLKTMWTVTGFFPIEGGVELKFGDGNLEIAENKLRGLML